MSIRTFILLALSFVLTACATTTTQPRSKARIEVQEQVGFTITESVKVDDAVRADYNRALAMLDQGQLESGISVLESVVERAPGVSGPRIDLGIAKHRQGDLEAAEAHLLQALELNPDHPVAHNELGIIYRKTGRFAQARSSYEAALAVFEETRAHSALAAKIDESFQANLREIGGYQKIAEVAFSNQRNRVLGI